MAKNKLQAKKYYDWHDIAKRFGFKYIDEVFEKDIITGNGCLLSIDKDLIEESEEFDEKSKTYKNQIRILKDLGPCEIHVWW